MYVGHLAAGFLLKSRVREAPLSLLLLATVLPDLLCGVLLVAGVEHVVVRGSVVYAHVEADMGYSHSLLSVAAVAGLAFVFGRTRSGSVRVGAALGLAVLSHFVLDALSHRFDMPLVGFGSRHDVRVGTNLALHPVWFFAVESAWCFFAWMLFDSSNRRLLLAFLVLLALWSNSIFGFAPPPAASEAVFGVSMLASFAVAGFALAWAACSRSHRLR